MIVTNPNCKCGNCKFQLECKNHALAIKVQNIAKYLGEDYSTICVRMEECTKFEKY